MEVVKKGPNLQAQAKIQAPRDTVIEASFYLVDESEGSEQPIGTSAGTVGGRGFVKLSSDKLQGVPDSHKFEVRIANAPGVTCSVTASAGTTSTCTF